MNFKIIKACKLKIKGQKYGFKLTKCSGWDLTDAVIVELFSCTIIGVGWTKLKNVYLIAYRHFKPSKKFILKLNPCEIIYNT